MDINIERLGREQGQRAFRLEAVLAWTVRAAAIGLFVVSSFYWGKALLMFAVASLPR